jgi:hypothetical protein
MISGQYHSYDRRLFADSALVERCPVDSVRFLFPLPTRIKARFSSLAALVVLIGALLSGVPRAVHASESYDNCTGFITSLPASINTPGTWCLKQDLSTAITGGDAISINADHVIIDCNHFALDGTPAGGGTTRGVAAQDHLGAIVRHCDIRGFNYGVYLAGTNSEGGHIVEDNRFYGNTGAGILVQGDRSILRRNEVLNTASGASYVGVIGIYATYSVDILDNTVSGVDASGYDSSAMGIYTTANVHGIIAGNRVRGMHVAPGGVGEWDGIFNSNPVNIILRDNDVSSNEPYMGMFESRGIECYDGTGRASNNVVSGFSTAMGACSDAGGNDITP